ncbi:hypothetical protein OsJ_26380 [Oryza sativa Japonica Group]|uniref:Uncharacterized protein n=2 Tax=Oryza sativa subsp. japonica TaxID=39947 RepID=A0A8J8YLA6_ORYSJ|nr:hypothetical protein OsJ_26380 [Oryza sativa Japonica Group]BAH00871.1 unnamed protein product [Oryza sativa Japonica Group]
MHGARGTPDEHPFSRSSRPASGTVLCRRLTPVATCKSSRQWRWFRCNGIKHARWCISFSASPFVVIHAHTSEIGDRERRNNQRKKDEWCCAASDAAAPLAGCSSSAAAAGDAGQDRSKRSGGAGRDIGEMGQDDVAAVEDGRRAMLRRRRRRQHRPRRQPQEQPRHQVRLLLHQRHRLPYHPAVSSYRLFFLFAGTT